MRQVDEILWSYPDQPLPARCYLLRRLERQPVAVDAAVWHKLLENETRGKLGGFASLAEFASASIHLSNAIKEVFVLYEAERAGHPGQLPVLSCTGSQAMKDRYGTNYRPTFDIISWVDRPADLVDASPVDPADLWQGETSASSTRPTPAQHVPPPVTSPLVASSPVTSPPVALPLVASPAAPVEDPMSQSVF